MTPKVTIEQLAEIKRAVAAGESHRSIGARLGLDHRTVGRASARLALVGASTSKATSPATPPTCDADTLRAQIERLRLLTETDLPPRDQAAISGELRQSILALAKLERLRPSEHDVSREVAESAARVRARLEKMAEKRIHSAPDPDAAPISATGTEGRR